MTDEPESDDTAEVSDLEMARRKTRETLEHIEAMDDATGFWGFLALIVGLVLKGVLWQADRKTPEAGAGGDADE